MIQRITGHSLAAAIPVSYISFFDDFSDPMKAGGFVVIVLQGIFLAIKIVKELREKKESDDD